MSYADKLRDPKWQKRRLEIMERDKWTCLACADTKSTLNVHHLIYSNEPWDSPDHHLETLCEACHEKREEFNKIYGRSIMPTHGLFAFLVFNQILKNHPTRRIISDRLGMEFHFYLCCRKAEELNISTEAASALIRNTTHEKNTENPVR